jgi:hypothetical protein
METISYLMPAFKLHGMLVYFAAAVVGGTGKFTSTSALAVTSTVCVWVTSCPFSFQRARIS